MAALQILVLTAAITASGETVLLDFSADWCPPCRSMEPVLKRMAAEGYPVRQINIEHHQKLASQYRIEGLPTFVLLSNGREVKRVEGAVSQAELVKMFAAAGFDPKAKKENFVRAQSPENQPAREDKSATIGLLSKAIGSMSAGNRKTTSRGMHVSHQQIETSMSAAPKADASLSPTQIALRATVRLTVEDPEGISYGAGTIIDTHGEEALIVTCGHIFRDSKGKGRITIDLFTPSGDLHVEGQLIAYDATTRDIGLVSFRPGVRVTPVRVAPAGYSILREARVFSVGCDHGAAPSVRESKITAVNKYLGPPNIEIAGQPVEGRSGGGLYCAEGLLIGVCNAADPADNEGIYAALETVQWQLDQIGQASVYQQVRQGLVQTPAMESGPVRKSGPPPRPVVRLASHSDGAGDRSLVRNSAIGAIPEKDDLEVIFILRSRSQPNSKSDIIVLDSPSRELLEILRRESQILNAAFPAVQAGREVDRRSLSAGRTIINRPDRGRIIRGQSSDN